MARSDTASVGSAGAAGGLAATKREQLAQGVPATMLAELCAKYAATYDYSRDGETAVFRLHLASGDVIAGRGADAIDAIANLKTRVEALV